MRKVAFALLLACFAVPAWAGLCPNCEDQGGGGTPPPPPQSPVPPPPPPPVQPRIDSAKVDPAQGTIEIQLNTGATFVIDDDLNKMFIASAAHSAELNLNTVLLQWAGGNIAKANQLRTRIHNMVVGNINTSALAKGAPVQGLMMGMPGGQPWDCYFSGYYCNIRPANDFVDGSTNWGTYSYGFYATEGAGGGEGTPDHNYWKHFRDQACDAKRTGGRMMVIGTLGAVATCPFFETGIGALGCAASGLSIVDGYDGFTDNAQKCEAPYPGPGKW